MPTKICLLLPRVCDGQEHSILPFEASDAVLSKSILHLESQPIWKGFELLQCDLFANGVCRWWFNWAQFENSEWARKTYNDAQNRGQREKRIDNFPKIELFIFNGRDGDNASPLHSHSFTTVIHLLLSPNSHSQNVFSFIQNKICRFLLWNSLYEYLLSINHRLHYHPNAFLHHHHQCRTKHPTCQFRSNPLIQSANTSRR